MSRCVVAMHLVVALGSPTQGGTSGTNHTCSSLATDTGIGHGDDCGSVKGGTAESCCAACLANVSCCVAFTFSRNTCYLKNNADSRAYMPGRTSGVVLGPPPPPSRLTVTLSSSGVINTVSPNYVSFSLDTSSNRGWFSRNITDPRLINLAKGLTPAVLRVGGSGNNCLQYNVPASAPKVCNDSAPCCMNQTQWDNLNAFAAATNTSLVFGLRGQAGGNVSDTEHLLNYTAATGYKLLGFEYGNERGCRLGAGLPELSELINRAWAQRPDPPPTVIGPDAIQYDIIDANHTDACVSTFFNGSASVNVLAFTYHFYLQTHSPDYSASELDHLGQVAAPITAAVRRYRGESPTEVWAGEMGGHSGGGVEGVTDTFASHQWYLDALGLLATLGHSLHVRQDLVGGNYGLLQDNFPFGPWVHRAAVPATPAPPGWQPNNGYNVLPDFWAAVVWKKVMGSRVLSVVSGGAASNSTRVYAHCTEGGDSEAGAVTLLVINIDTVAPVDVALPLHTGAPTVWAMTAPRGNVTGVTVALNGEVLAVNPDYTVPEVAGAEATGVLDSVTVPPQAYTFVVLPGVAPQWCP